jgi:5-formyltetrahydrofolate cyclo-ligase
MMTSKKMQNYTIKSEFRAYCKSRLQKSTIAPRKRAIDKKIILKIYRLITTNKSTVILAYVPLCTEVDILSLINRLRMEKKIVLVPFMEHESFRLVKYRLPLKKKKFGIKEPHDSKQFRNNNIDLAIVPILGVDLTGRRVGFGKGMYDRFFEKEQKNIKNTLFISRELLINKKIITDGYDILPTQSIWT